MLCKISPLLTHDNTEFLILFIFAIGMVCGTKLKQAFNDD
jgi:hypothetical protein